MRKVVLLFATVLFMLPGMAQDLSVDVAMQRMKKSAEQFLKGEFTKVDYTGIDQYVDASVKSVHSFSDYSYGNLLPYFVDYINNRSHGIGSGNVQAENIRMLEYAQKNLTKVAAYAALVDFKGKTKFGETVDMSSLFFFDWKGNTVAVRPGSFNRDDYKSSLAKCMEKKVRKELAEMKDPLFNKEKWVSETVYSTLKGKIYEMKYCLIFDRGEMGGNGVSGPFKAYFYQVQSGSLAQVKSLTLVNGRYEWTGDTPSFNYKKSSVSTYLVKSNYVRSFEIDDFSDIDGSKMEVSILNSTSTTKAVRSQSDTPAVFSRIDDDHLKMTIPFSEEVFLFTKVDE